MTKSSDRGRAILIMHVCFAIGIGVHFGQGYGWLYFGSMILLSLLIDLVMKILKEGL
jgi:hypothetical protein